MKLVKVKLENYRNLDGIEVELSEDTNYIVGENNLGKSNFLEFITKVLMKKNFIEEDFKDLSAPILAIIRFKLTDEEKGVFDDLIDPMNPDFINIKVVQNNADENIEYTHLETGNKISSTDIKKLLVVNYDSLRNPKNELDFSKTRGAGTFLNYLIKEYLTTYGGTSILKQSEIKKIEKYMHNVLKNLVPFNKFGIEAIAEENAKDLIGRIMFLKDENSINLSESGYGVQYTILIVLSILERIIQHVKKNPNDKEIQTVLIFDEPEIHLHPYMQRTLMKDIGQIAAGEDEKFNKIISDLFGIKKFSGQIIVSTHSPSILSDDYSKIIRFYSDDKVTKVVNSSSLILNDSEKKQLKLQYMYIKEAVFAKGVIIVEGASEYGAFRYFADLMDIDLDRTGISVIRANGAENIVPLMDLFDKIKILNIGIMDKDKKSSRNENRANLLFTTQLDFDIEFVNYMFKKNKIETLEKILMDYDSKGLNRSFQKSAIEKIKNKYKLNIEVDSNLKFSDLTTSDPKLKLLYITWFSTRKSITLGNVIGENIDKDCIPMCYKKAINSIKRDVEKCR